MLSVFQYYEYVGISTVGLEDAIKNALDAAQAKGTISWFEVNSVRGRITQDKAIEYQVTVKCGCK